MGFYNVYPIFTDVSGESATIFLYPKKFMRNSGSSKVGENMQSHQEWRKWGRCREGDSAEM
jgi:hypothetical protein